MRRRRLAISLKGLLLLVLILGVLLGWHRARDQRRAVQALRDSGGTLYYDWEFVGGLYTPGRTPPGPAWLRRLLGDEFFQEVAWVGIAETHEGRRSLVRALDRLPRLHRLRELHLTGRSLHDADLARIRDVRALETLQIDHAPALTDAGVAHLRGLDGLRSIAINDCTLTDASLAHLAAIPALEEVDLRGNRLTDAGLVWFSRLPRLRVLRLGYGSKEITDRGMPSLRGVRNLEVLGIEFTNVGDEGLRSLEGLPNLKEISTGGSMVTPEGIAHLRRVSPGIRVVP